MTVSASKSPASLREALSSLRACGERVVEVDAALDPHLDIAEHYRAHFATSPAGQRSGDEPVVLYRSARGAFPVLMGLFGSRQRNDRMLGAKPGQAAPWLAHCLASPVPPIWTAEAACHAQHATEGLKALPILTTTAEDAGATRYHSLVVSRNGFPDDLVVSAYASDDQQVMGVRHRHLPIEGVQFHPESIATEGGPSIFSSFIDHHVSSVVIETRSTASTTF